MAFFTAVKTSELMQKKLWPSEFPTDLKETQKSVAGMKGRGEFFKSIIIEMKTIASSTSLLYINAHKSMLDNVSMCYL
jgi:hypothetical protein